MLTIFFFSSRRRHTRCGRDWSSDVCSSDLGSINRDLARYLTMIEGGDVRPAQSAWENATVACEALRKDLARWRAINSERLPALNKLLERHNLLALGTLTPPADPVCSVR